MQCRFWGGTIAAALYLPLLDGAFTFADDPEHVQEYSRQVLKNAATVEEVKEKLVAWYQNHMEVGGLHTMGVLFKYQRVGGLSLMGGIVWCLTY